MKNPLAEAKFYNSFEFTMPNDALEDIEYFCPDPTCLDPAKRLFLRKSSLGKQFFTHRVGKEHEIHPKTLLHKIIVGQFGTLSKYKLPQSIDGKKVMDIDREKSIIEFKGLEGDVPDIYLVDKDGFKCFVEVTIGFHTDKKKLESVKNLNVPLVEINLEKYYDENAERIKSEIKLVFDDIERLLHTNSRFTFIPSTNKVKKKLSLSTTSTLIGGAVLLSAAGLATYFSLRSWRNSHG